jgi:hypothetical protein
MIRRWLAGFVALASLTASAALVAGGCSSDPAEEPCQDGTFQCVGLELQRCDAGTFVTDLMCSEEMPCRAEHGHCHPGDGGHSAGGHHMGGGGHDEGGGGHHEGGGGSSAGGSGGAGGA